MFQDLKKRWKDLAIIFGLSFAATLFLSGHADAQLNVRNTYQITSYPTRAIVVTPSDSTVFAEPSTIYVGAEGNVAVLPENSAAPVTFIGLPAGSTVPVLVREVLSTGTTADSMIRIY